MPLRGGHRGGLFYTDTKTTQKIASHATSALLTQEPAWGLRLFAALAPPGAIFGEIVERDNNNKKPEKPRHWPWAVVMWGSSPRRHMEVTGGLLRTRPFLVFQFGGQNAITSNLRLSGDDELHNKKNANAVPLASARQHPENQKEENQAGHSSERAVEGQNTALRRAKSGATKRQIPKRPLAKSTRRMNEISRKPATP